MIPISLDQAAREIADWAAYGAQETLDETGNFSAINPVMGRMNCVVVSIAALLGFNAVSFCQTVGIEHPENGYTEEQFQGLLESIHSFFGPRLQMCKMDSLAEPEQGRRGKIAFLSWDSEKPPHRQIRHAVVHAGNRFRDYQRDSDGRDVSDMLREKRAELDFCYSIVIDQCYIPNIAGRTNNNPQVSPKVPEQAAIILRALVDLQAQLSLLEDRYYIFERYLNIFVQTNAKIQNNISVNEMEQGYFCSALDESVCAIKATVDEMPDLEPYYRFFDRDLSYVLEDENNPPGWGPVKNPWEGKPTSAMALNNRFQVSREQYRVISTPGIDNYPSRVVEATRYMYRTLTVSIRPVASEIHWKLDTAQFG
ncbi:hypothetical protein BDV23DRAFT_180585 [Aspergillus alliaceus]|uniref:Uncharacterized protein n=1 Tax=Petromyces alliaceus TaxID=209559 RepID=A0A5N7CH56_PETAA|nr:hypothetical protein BDV23DRAFT_180585 [Aspergillus alliaceus]